MNETRAKLLTAARDTLRDDGVAGASARNIATRAGVNQALVFYHFTTVSELLEAASQQAVNEAIAQYREQFAVVSSLSGLLAVGRELHIREQATGNVAVMAQLMSGAGKDAGLARGARYAMDTWTAEIESVLRRVLHRSPIAEFTDFAGLARAISASFIGLELYEGVDPVGAVTAFDALERLGLLTEVIDDLGPVARRALRAKLKSQRL